jgi:hypothetical protein
MLINKFVAILSCLQPDDLRPQPRARLPLARCSARILQHPLSQQTNRATTRTAFQTSSPPHSSLVAPAPSAAIDSFARIVAQLVLRLIHALSRRALAAQNLKKGSQAAAAALATRRRSERLTDAFTKLLLPGTKMRFASACVIRRKRLL